MAKFKQEILEQIKNEPTLFGLVAEALGVRPVSLIKAIERNGPSLNQYSIVTLVATHLGKEASKIVEEELMGEQK